MLQIKYVMAGALCVSVFVQGTERRLELEPVPTLSHESVIKDGYEFAQANVPDGELSGTVPELYREILEKGYQGFLDSNREIEQRTLEILDLFNNPVSEDTPEIKAAADAFDLAVADPNNVDLWLKEFELFSKALINLVKSRQIGPCKLHPQTAQRIILNNKLQATPEERIEIGAHMAAVTGRFSQRYRAMNEETFVAFRARAAAVIAALVQPQ